MKKLLLTSLCVLASTVFAVPLPTKKLIHFGWNEPHLLKEYQSVTPEQFAKDLPFDGIGFRPLFELQRDGKTVRYKLGRPPQSGLIMLKKEDFTEWIAVFRKLKAETRLKYNFFDLSAILFSPNWFDDKAWELTMNNFTTMAWLAKESGFAGLALDVEAYPFAGYPFAFNPKYGHTYEETARQIRKRAKQWIEGITREFPDMHLHCCFWTCLCKDEGMAKHPINSGNYAFTVPFFNGVYDGAPDTMTIHEGVESQGYKASGKADFTQIVADFHRFGPAWIAPENLDKYKKLTKLSIALYLDSYFKREKPGPWTLFATTDNPTRLLHENTSLALTYSDEFAWFWCEHGTFWPDITRSPESAPDWNVRIPYAREAIQIAETPYALPPQFLGTPLNKNPELNPPANFNPAKPNSNIPGWSVWHEEKNPAGKGAIYFENGGARFKKIANGAISQGITSFKPGETYLFTARAKMETDSIVPNINYFFRDASGEGLWHLRQSAFFEQDEPDGWKRASILIRVPQRDDLTQMAICISATGYGNAIPDTDPGIFFDDVQLFKVTLPWDTTPKASGSMTPVKGDTK